MAVAWSKTVPYSCYELGHCWTPGCWDSFSGIALDTFKYSVKVYGTLYLLAAILRRRKKEYFVKRFIPETIRSAIFLTANGSLFIGTFCFWRYILGNTANMFPICGFLPAATASFLAILLERKPRRAMLALYLLNLAVETGFNSAVAHGLVSKVQHGEVLLFSIALAVYTYFYKKEKSTDCIKRLIGFFVGRAELPPKTQDGVHSTHDQGTATESKSSHRPTGIISYVPKELKAIVTLWRRGPKHSLCRHQFGCAANSIESGVRMFVAGYVIQATMKLVRAITNIMRNPRGLLDALKHMDNVRLGLFLGSFTASIRLCNCVMRWLTNKDNPINGLVSGFAAGWSMLWYKSSTIAMWVTSKLAEILYSKGIEAKMLPNIKYGDVLVYTLSTAYVLHSAVFEPHNIRPAYWRFLLNLTNQKFSMMNRKLLDGYGTNASQLYPDYWPKYDSRYSNL